MRGGCVVRVWGGFVRVLADLVRYQFSGQVFMNCCYIKAFGFIPPISFRYCMSLYRRREAYISLHRRIQVCIGRIEQLYTLYTVLNKLTYK